MDARNIPEAKREAYVRLHFQKAARELGYAAGSQKESEFINRETYNVMHDGHPMEITVTAEQLRDIQES